MEMQILTCTNPSCPSPQWERERTRGRVPVLCPPCKESKPVTDTDSAPKAAREDSAPKVQNLTCQNPACVEPNWSRPSQKGNLPRFCPACKDVMTKEEAVEVIDTSAFANDEEAFLSLVPADGAVSNSSVQARLGWDDVRYMNVKQALMDGQKIHTAKGGGRCGAVRLFTPDDIEEEEAPKVQILICQECEKEWTRPSARGKPSYCPECKVAKAEETGEEDDYSPDPEVPKSFDPAVFSSKEKTEIELVMGQLRRKYPKTNFYIQGEDEITIMLKRNYPVPVSPDVLESVRDFAVKATLPA